MMYRNILKVSNNYLIYTNFINLCIQAHMHNLPVEMRTIGDVYVKDEFRQNVQWYIDGNNSSNNGN